MAWSKNPGLRVNCKEETCISKLSAIKKLGLPENRKLILDYIDMRTANSVKTATKHSELITLYYLIKFAGKRPFMKLTRQDIMGFLAAVRERKFESRHYRKRMPCRKPLSPSTMDLHKLILRMSMSGPRASRSR